MSDSEKRRPQRVREADAPDGEFWTVVSKPGADPVMLSGPGLCRAMCSVSRDDFERFFQEVPE